MDDTRVVEVLLPNGTTALVRAVDVEGVGATKTGVLGRLEFAELAGTLEGLTEAIKVALTKAEPDKVTVELGIMLAIKSGKLTGMLVEGHGTGSLRVTLEWERDGARS